MKAFKHQVDFDTNYAENTWKVLEHAIHEIYNHNASGLNFEELYRNAYSMVLHKYGEKLYAGLVNTMTGHLKEIAKSIEAAQGGLFLEELNVKWGDHNKALQMIRQILMYMDRTFVPSSCKTPVHELGLNLWRDNIIRDSKIKSKSLDTLLDLIHRERTGEEDFEKPFLEFSTRFYSGEAQQLIECCDCGNYLRKAEKHHSEEIERVSRYVDAKTEVKITSVVEGEMIANHMQRLVHLENSGLVNMLVDDKYGDLSIMYNLFC
ncbi:Cullin protein neddylation domain [Musa troglodytarum]|uniref:Cullin protein neddylation domain n=1 Tax=Musa troglodytarum TaxID=320322 RepID=A0A9E7EGD6_9LILI|nr:Cullin protein neddylation domain [Musa troglodytarum]